MDDLLVDLFFDLRLQGALDPQINRPPQLLLQIAAQSEEVAKRLVVRPQFDGKVDIGVLPRSSDRAQLPKRPMLVTPKRMFQLLLVPRQKVYDIAFDF